MLYLTTQADFIPETRIFLRLLSQTSFVPQNKSLTSAELPLTRKCRVAACQKKCSDIAANLFLYL